MRLLQSGNASSICGAVKQLYTRGKLKGVYKGYRLALIEDTIEMGIRNVEVFMDSKLVVEQMNGRWKINNQFLKMIFDEIQNLKLNFDYITFTHIYRDLNKTADKLANLSFT
jgi:ribonuclease HI